MALQVLSFGLSAAFAFAQNPVMAMDKMTDEELRPFRDYKIIELRGIDSSFIQNKRQTVSYVQATARHVDGIRV